MWRHRKIKNILDESEEFGSYSDFSQDNPTEEITLSARTLRAGLKAPSVRHLLLTHQYNPRLSFLPHCPLGCHHPLVFHLSFLDSRVYRRLGSHSLSRSLKRSLLSTLILIYPHLWSIHAVLFGQPKLLTCLVILGVAHLLTQLGDLTKYHFIPVTLHHTHA